MKEMKEIIELKKKIENRNIILFVGAGVSKNVGLPDFSELIAVMAKNVGIDADLFNMYGSFWSLAEYYYLQKSGHLTLFKNRLKKMWNNKDIKKNIRESKIYDHIINLNFSTIYTTNYDECLEIAYDLRKRRYAKISNLEDIAKFKKNKTKIIKYHGDINSTKDDWVLTETSYFERMDFEHPLDIMFRSDCLGTSVLFIGYSINDMNIRYLLYKLTKQWRKDNAQDTKPKSYIFLTTPNIVQEEILKSWGIIPIIAPMEESPGVALEKFLKSLL